MRRLVALVPLTALPFILSSLLFAACGSGSASFEQCELDLETNLETVMPGDTLVLTGGPQSERFDTVVRIGDVQADVLEVLRQDCTICDECREQQCVTLCRSCSQCAPSCDTCEEELTVTIPELAAGPADVVVTNRFGISSPLPVNVDVPDDTDTDVDSDTDSDTLAN